MELIFRRTSFVDVDFQMTKKLWYGYFKSKDRIQKLMNTSTSHSVQCIVFTDADHEGVAVWCISYVNFLKCSAITLECKLLFFAFYFTTMAYLELKTCNLCCLPALQYLDASKHRKRFLSIYYFLINYSVSLRL